MKTELEGTAPFSPVLLVVYVHVCLTLQNGQPESRVLCNSCIPST